MASSSHQQRSLTNGVRTHSLSALSSLSTVDAMVDPESRPTIAECVEKSRANVGSLMLGRPKAGQPEVENSFPEFRPDHTGWARRRRSEGGLGEVRHRNVNFEEGEHPTSRRYETPTSPLIAQFSEALASELAKRLREAMASSVDQEALEGYVRRARERVAEDEPRQQGVAASLPRDDTRAEEEKKEDNVRPVVANLVSRLSTLEGRQRALQGKMAKLDANWGGDASQMSLAVAELQQRNSLDATAELGSLRGQLIALAHSIDKLDKRTAAIERRLNSTAPTVTIDGYSRESPDRHHPAYPQYTYQPHQHHRSANYYVPPPQSPDLAGKQPHRSAHKHVAQPVASNNNLSPAPSSA